MQPSQAVRSPRRASTKQCRRRAIDLRGVRSARRGQLEIDAGGCGADSSKLGSRAAREAHPGAGLTPRRAANSRVFMNATCT